MHVEKANPEIRGLYAVINRDFAKNAWGDVTYLNREEDMGHEGLRMAKESYKPEFMVKNIPLFLNNRGLYGFRLLNSAFCRRRQNYGITALKKGRPFL